MNVGVNFEVSWGVAFVFESVIWGVSFCFGLSELGVIFYLDRCTWIGGLFEYYKVRRVLQSKESVAHVCVAILDGTRTRRGNAENVISSSCSCCC